STAEDPGNYYRHLARTSRATPGPVYHRRFTLDGPNDPGIIESADRSDPNCFHASVADLSSHVPAILASPFLSHRNDGEPLIPCPGGTVREPYDRWKSLTTRDAPADSGQDRRGTAVRRGNDQSHSGIGTAHSTRGALRTHRVVRHVHDSCHAARL